MVPPLQCCNLTTTQLPSHRRPFTLQTLCCHLPELLPYHQLLHLRHLHKPHLHSTVLSRTIQGRDLNISPTPSSLPCLHCFQHPPLQVALLLTIRPPPTPPSRKLLLSTALASSPTPKALALSSRHAHAPLHAFITTPTLPFAPPSSLHRRPPQLPLQTALRISAPFRRPTSLNSTICRSCPGSLPQIGRAHV